MNFIILADKFKKGMKSKGCVGLIKTDQKKNIFQRQYNVIKSHSQKHNIVYIIGFEGGKFKNFLDRYYQYDIHLIENDKFIDKNAGFTISLAKNFLVSNCCILDGSTMLSTTAIDKMLENQHTSQLFLENPYGSIGCIHQNNRVTNLCIDLDNKIHDMIYLCQESANNLQTLLSAKHYCMFTFEIINQLLDSGNKFIMTKLRKNQICYHQ